jgi:nitrite reductase/ring-hydroxylating ferredoxin subunit
VARARDVLDGERLLVKVAGREIGVFNVGGAYYALLNLCPHLGGPLCRGTIIGLVQATRPGEIKFDGSRKLLTCPWHAWEFDLVTGQSYCSPNRLRARRIALETAGGETVARDVEAGRVERVAGPYKAETIPIEVQDDYLIVSIRGAQVSADSPEEK